jgi:hypothetical protein
MCYFLYLLNDLMAAYPRRSSTTEPKNTHVNGANVTVANLLFIFKILISTGLHRAPLFIGKRQRRGAAGDSKLTAATQATIYGESDLQVTHSSPGLYSLPSIFFSEIAKLQLVPWQHLAHELHRFPISSGNRRS